MGEVFLAEHQLLKETVCDRLIRPDLARDPAACSLASSARSHNRPAFTLEHNRDLRLRSQ